jgi:hypothetical protein
MKNTIEIKRADEETKFNEVQKARRDLLAAFNALKAAHLKLQTNPMNAYETAEGDVRSICGLALWPK